MVGMAKLFVRWGLGFLVVLNIAACGGGGSGGSSGNDGGNGSVAKALADRFVVSGHSDGTLSISRVDPVAGFTSPIAYSKLSAFQFRELLHDTANDRVIAVTSNEIFLLSFDALTGAISEVDSRDTSGNTSHFALKDDASVAYVASGTTSGAIDVYTISGAGTLSPRVSVSLEVNPYFVTLNPAGDRLYVVSRSDDQIHILDINADGSLVPTPIFMDTDENPTALVFNEAGSLAYLSFSHTSSDMIQVYSVGDDGALEHSTSVDDNTNVLDLVLDEKGEHLYAITSNDRVYHYRVEDATGELTMIDSHSLFSSSSDLTLSPTGAELYVSHNNSPAVSTLAVDEVNGTLRVMGYARVFNNANTVTAIGGEGALVPTPKFLLAPDVSGLRVFEIGVDGGLNLQDTLAGSHALIDGQVAVQYVSGLLLGAGRNNLSPKQDLLTSYLFDPTGGDLTFIESANATVVQKDSVPGFQRIELGRAGQFLYVLDQDDTAEKGNLRTYAYTADGEINTTAVSNFAVGDGPENLSMHAAGRYLYSINSFSDRISRFQVNPTTGIPEGGQLYLPGNQGAGVGRPVDMKFHPNGFYAYISLANDHQVTRHVMTATGALDNPTRHTPPKVGESDVRPGPIGVHPTGQYLYVGEDVIDGPPHKIAIYDINQANFSLAYRSRVNVAGLPSWIELDPSGRLLYVRFRDQRIQVFTIDDSGGLTDTQQVVDAGNDAGFLPTFTLVAPLLVE